MAEKKERRGKRIALIVLACIVLFAIVIVSTVNIAYNHRSDPSDVIKYETTNKHITSGKTMIAAHRAGAGEAPEQTMMALKYCLENDDFTVDYFEFDLHLTKDDVLVLLHDDVLDEASDSVTVFGEENCRPENYTLEELKQLNMGATFVNDEGEMPYQGLTGGEVPEELKILSLDEAFDYLETDNSFKYIIEIKNDGELGKRGVDLLYKELQERDMVDAVAMGSYYEEVSHYKDEKYPDLARGAYTEEVLKFIFFSLIDYGNYQPNFQILQMPFNDRENDYHINTGTAKVMNYAHRHDIAIQYWTINDEVDAEYLMGMGADAIMTDYPDIMYKIREPKE